MKNIKKMGKELEKWLNIPHILLLNKEYLKDIKAKDKIIDEVNQENEFLKVNNENLNHKILKLKREIELCIK